jgi:ferredoxin
MGAYTDEIAEVVNKACKEYNVTVSTLWCGWPGPGEWDLYDGPLTLGIVPESYRWDRINHIKNGSDFAKKIGVVNVATHVGFLPECPNTTEYRSLVNAIRHLANHLKNNGQFLLFETGQETPVTLRRTIEDVGTDNLGINLDPANLILYGKGNPVDALDVFGDVDSLIITDYNNVAVRHSLLFDNRSKLFGKVAKAVLEAKPTVKSAECKGCEKCKQICPAQAITMKNGKPEIDRKKCIKCFCCQEFCPFGAMKVHRPAIAKLLNKNK